MIDEALDTTTHDLAYSNYDEQLVSDADQVAQNVKIRLLLIMGECFDNTTIGLDYFGTLFGGSGNPALIDSVIKSTILNTPEVTAILSYSSSYDRAGRSASVSARINTVYGEVQIANAELFQ